MELDAHTLYVMRKHRDLANLYGEAPAAITAAQEGFDKQILWALPQIEKNEYAIGDSFGGVDILLTTCLDWAVAYGFDLADAYHGYRARQHDRPAFQSARDLNFSITAGA